MNRAIYPGSFDPLTYGHLDIIQRSAKMFDEVVVVILRNSAKKSLFDVEERVKMIEEAVSDIPNVKVVSDGGLTADYAKEIGACAIIRGLRGVTDYEYELQIAQLNHVLNEDVDTVFLNTSLQYAFISSTIVKEVASYGGDISTFVPECILDKVLDKYKK